MTVHKLIKWLSKLPQDMQVKVRVPEYWEGETQHEDPKAVVDKENNLLLF